MLIPGSCDIGFLCSKLQIKANELYNMNFQNYDFETQVDRPEEKSKVDEGVDKSASVDENVHTWLV